MSRSSSATPDVGVLAWASVAGDEVDARHLALFGRAFRRIGRYVKLAQVGARACVGDRALDGRRTGVFLGSGLGNSAEIIPLVEGILHPTRPWSSPIAFAGSVGNAAAFYVARALELDGPNVTVSQEEVSFEAALLEAVLALREGRVTHALVGGVDVRTGEDEAHRARIHAEGVAGELIEGSGWLLLGPAEGAAARIVDVHLGAGADRAPEGATVLPGWRLDAPRRETRILPVATALRLVDVLDGREPVTRPGLVAHVQRTPAGIGARVVLALG